MRQADLSGMPYNYLTGVGGKYMRHHSEPIIGNWYDVKSFNECFTVVDYDDHDYVEIQYLDGELDRIDSDTWDALNPEEIPEPEDATAPYGVVHDQDVVELLKEIEDQDDIEGHIRHVDSDEEEWT